MFQSKQYREVALKALTKEWHQADQSADDAHDAEAVQEHHNTQPTRHSIVEGFNNLKKELSILCQLKHSHIVELYGVLLRPLGLVLELASKGSLKHICKEYNEKQTKLCSNVSQAVIKQVGGVSFRWTMTSYLLSPPFLLPLPSLLPSSPSSPFLPSSPSRSHRLSHTYTAGTSSIAIAKLTMFWCAGSQTHTIAHPGAYPWTPTRYW